MTDTAERGWVRRWQDSRRGEPLSGRQLRVLELVAAGETNEGIARVLFVSPETVKTYVQFVYGKLGARNRAHAVALGFRKGLLS